MQSQAPLNVGERNQSDKIQQKLNWLLLAWQLEEEAMSREMQVPPKAGKDKKTAPPPGLQMERSPATPISDI